MILSPDRIPISLWVIINARGEIVADLGDGTPLTQTEAEEGVAHLDRTEPDYVGPHTAVRYIPAPVPTPGTT